MNALYVREGHMTHHCTKNGEKVCPDCYLFGMGLKIIIYILEDVNKNSQLK
jgi:hypothetical protein